MNQSRRLSHQKINGQDITNLHIPIVAGELENRNFFSLEIQSPRQGLRLYLGIRASVTALLSKMDDEFRRKKVCVKPIFRHFLSPCVIQVPLMKALFCRDDDERSMLP